MHVKLYDANGNYITKLDFVTSPLSDGDNININSNPPDIWLYTSMNGFCFDNFMSRDVNKPMDLLVEKLGWAGLSVTKICKLYMGGANDFKLYTKTNHVIQFHTLSGQIEIYVTEGSAYYSVPSRSSSAYFLGFDGANFFTITTDTGYNISNPYHVYEGWYVNKVSRNSVSQNWLQSVFGDCMEKDATDPYEDGGISDEGGGGGNFDDTSDPIETPSIPSISALTSKFVSMYNPTVGQLASLSDYMWLNPLFDVDNWKKLFADPMDAILGLSIVPVQPQTSGTTAVKIGNLSTDIEMARVSSQFVEIDCGTLNIDEYWGAYLDYSPYTKIEIYLPYCGTHSLDTDDVMDKSVNVKYHIDILSGACCAYIIVSGTVLYTFTGQCSCSLPITSNNMADIMRGALNVATSLGSMVASGGMSAPSVMGAIGSISSTVMSSKPHIEKSGSVNGTAGLLAVQKPYLIINRPNQCLPKGQNEYLGYPSFITKKVSDLAGYTQFADIHLINMSATDSEKDELISLLKGGVIL